ncbi:MULTISPECIES: organic hydroperoxide resistance protein [Virgibacillus]|uniref:Organic hydroperoxide resistance protein n=1 Tax=Virgibacillus halodenitrificans TaxID=1482 RepID=A0AAC9J0M2_VIRHA|nr:MULTISPECIES: organic hydroperoxide resistance protein [Virgibacillus]AIF43817.1 Organic hydroperoxide resistance protein ohrA [Virgibacillus sp. SK37]APC48690.1 Organic hydroperoxide resistance protein OhrA [Virgibacillus halodenitrificans]MBD1224488.1 organic hydroperoxide resistance protein [Virgibacillus halodenitrificans]MCG1028640.1 organic hydroperoxide resistance protein [Virgibacillus halodenitrificans]MCJ0931266.1 organic hydroperoxide resistance protein [Virgibacillus halodenitri
MSDVLFTSTATAKNGREGHVKSKDELIDLELVNPITNKEDKGSNPEQLFAAAYAACYDGALNLVASKQKKKISSETTADVSLLKDPEDDGFKIGVTLTVNIEGVNPEEADELTEAAHQVCPYSKATRGNVDVKINAKAV